MKEVLADICAAAGGLMIGTNIGQLDTTGGCISTFLGVGLLVAAFLMARKMK